VVLRWKDLRMLTLAVEINTGAPPCWLRWRETRIFPACVGSLSAIGGGSGRGQSKKACARKPPSMKRVRLAASQTLNARCGLTVARLWTCAELCEEVGLDSVSVMISRLSSSGNWTAIAMLVIDRGFAKIWWDSRTLSSS
jgi:hypothetical protein